jgi:rhomboid family protein
VRVPIVNYALIGLVAAVFFLQVSFGNEAIYREYAFVPDDLRRALEDGRFEVVMRAASTIFSSMFLHGGWIHVIGNLLYLRVFGDNLEDRFGHMPYLLFYLASGAAGAIAHMTFGGTNAPTIGASGAIAGVLGAYVVLFPSARVLTLFPVFIFLTFIEVPAFVFLGIWALQQFLNGYFVLSGAPQPGDIAWFAHIGGFSLGIVCGLAYRLLARKRTRVVQETEVA